MKTDKRSRRTPQRKPQSPGRKVYHPSKALRTATLIVMVVLSVAALAFAFISTRSLISTAFCALPIGIFIALVFSYMVYAVRHTYLVLAPDGVEYHTANVAIRTPWENIERVIEDPFAPRLVLRDPQPVEPLTKAVRDRTWSRTPSGRAIPLRLFGYSRSSELHRDLQRYAPYLFQPAERSPQA